MSSDGAVGVTPIEWVDARGAIGGFPGSLRLLDQTVLPGAEDYLDVRTVDELWLAISRLAVRGAPAIGIAAAYGVVLAIGADPASVAGVEPIAARKRARAAADSLATSRPTAVNLFTCLDRMRRAIDAIPADTSTQDIGLLLLAEARAIHAEDKQLCEAIAAAGIDRMPNGDPATTGILTHCNTGTLATGGIGTAIGVITSAWAAGKRFRVYACETRPLLQGARLTAWELQRAGIPTSLITDSTAASVMQRGFVQAVIVGADRIANNGDTANKIGTYSHAVAAKYHNIPFYVAAPLTTFDAELADGTGIPIEQRKDDVLGFGPVRTAPPEIDAYAPAFDVTPAELITGIITEGGLLEPPFIESIAAVRAALSTGGRG